MPNRHDVKPRGRNPAGLFFCALNAPALRLTGFTCARGYFIVCGGKTAQIGF